MRLYETATLFELCYHTRAFLFMSYALFLLTAVRLYASHTDDVVVKIDENTSQIKGNIKTMQSDASRIDARLNVLQRAVKKLERHLDDQEREELLEGGKAQRDQDVDETDSPSVDIGPGSNRMSVASYNSSLRRSLRDLNSIISSSSAMSRMSSLLNPAIPESAEMDNSGYGEHPSQEGSLSSGQEVDGPLEDDEKNQAFIERTLVGLQVDGYLETELSMTPTLKKNSPTLAELNDYYFDHRIYFDQTPEGHDWDSKAANFPATRPWVTLNRLPVSPRPSSYLQDPRPPPLPPALHKRQVSESAIETIRRPEPPAPAIVPISNSMSLVLVNLKERVEDWKGHNPEHFGDLILHEVLMITEPNDLRHTFHIYLFERILLCCKPFSPKNSSDKKGSLQRSKLSDQSHLQASPLRLKGRIFMYNVKNVVPYSKDGQYRMQVFWKGDADEESFMIHFHDEDTMRTWILAFLSAI